MHILNIGFNYKSTPIEVRERLSFDVTSLPKAIIALKEKESILETVIISTCNRTEIYAVVDDIHSGKYVIKRFLANWFQYKEEDFTSFLQIRENNEVLEHLFRLSIGLDSMVLGETEILGQVKQAFFTSQQIKGTGTIFNELFKRAITFAKRAHNQTRIGEHSVSISYIAVELAKDIFTDLCEKKVLVLGAGKMGELAVKNLQGTGVSHVTIINRTYERASALARKFGVTAEKYENLAVACNQADIIICSTSSNHIVITKELLKNEGRRNDYLLIVDIAVPRDVDHAVGTLDHVLLYDIDDLQQVVAKNGIARKNAAKMIEKMLKEEIVSFNKWMKMLDVVPMIAALKQKAFTIQLETMNSIERKMPHLSDRERKVLKKHTNSIVNQLIKDPIQQVKELASAENAEDVQQLFIKMFGIEEELKFETSKIEDSREVEWMR